jgi:hypothetical protein
MPTRPELAITDYLGRPEQEDILPSKLLEHQDVAVKLSSREFSLYITKFYYRLFSMVLRSLMHLAPAYGQRRK